MITVITPAREDVCALSRCTTRDLLAFMERGSIAAWAVLIRFRGYRSKYVN